MKKIKLIVVAFILALAVVSCGDGSKTATDETTDVETSTESMESETSSYDPKRGEGKFDESNVVVVALDEAMAKRGEGIAGTKCTSCHKLTDEKLVGPGWKDVTVRRTPHWIMNFITNPDPMIDKDPEVQAQLETCLVRMPNQSLTDVDARDIVEYMRKLDGAK